MVQWVRACIYFPAEDLSLLSETHIRWLTITGNSNSKASDTSGLNEHLYFHMHITPHRHIVFLLPSFPPPSLPPSKINLTKKREVILYGFCNRKNGTYLVPFPAVHLSSLSLGSHLHQRQKAFIWLSNMGLIFILTNDDPNRPTVLPKEPNL